MVLRMMVSYWQRAGKITEKRLLEVFRQRKAIRCWHPVLPVAMSSFRGKLLTCQCMSQRDNIQGLSTPDPERTEAEDELCERATTGSRRRLNGVAGGDHRGHEKDRVPPDQALLDEAFAKVSMPFELRLLNGMNPPVPEVTVLIHRITKDRRAGEYRLHIKKVLGFKHWDKRRQQPKL